MEYILEGIRVTLITPNLSTTSHTAAHFNSRLWIYDKQTRCCYEIAKKFCRESNFSHGHWLVKKKMTKPKCNASSPSVIGKDANVNCALEEFQYIAYLGLHEPCKYRCLEYLKTRQNWSAQSEPTRHGRTDTSNGSVMGPNHQNPTSTGRVVGFVLKNPIYPTRPTKPQKEGENLVTFGLLNSYLAMFGLPLLRFAQILTQICLNLMNLAEIYSNSTKL